jgi:hypothetical protein
LIPLDPEIGKEPIVKGTEAPQVITEAPPPCDAPTKIAQRRCRKSLDE